MFECVLDQGDLFKKIIVAIGDLVTEGNFQVDQNHMSFQGMDSSHVSLVSLSLQEKGFNTYRCDRDKTLGVNFESLNKVMKCMGTKDSLGLKCMDSDEDSLYIMYENENGKVISNFELKLMDIETEQLGIPDTEYAVNVKIPSNTFQKIVRDLSSIGDSVTISVNKEGIKFTVHGDIGKGDIHLHGIIDNSIKNKNKNKNNNNNKIKQEDDDGKKEEQNSNDDDEDDDMQGNTPDGNSNNDENKMDDDDKINAVDENDDDDKTIKISLDEPVQQTFALRYLINFTKATTLSKHVTLSMGNEVPLRVDYRIDVPNPDADEDDEEKTHEIGYLNYFLAPKIDDEN